MIISSREDMILSDKGSIIDLNSQNALPLLENVPLAQIAAGPYVCSVNKTEIMITDFQSNKTWKNTYSNNFTPIAMDGKYVSLSFKLF